MCTSTCVDPGPDPSCDGTPGLLLSAAMEHAPDPTAAAHINPSHCSRARSYTAVPCPGVLAAGWAPIAHLQYHANGDVTPEQVGHRACITLLHFSCLPYRCTSAG